MKIVSKSVLVLVAAQLSLFGCGKKSEDSTTEAAGMPGTLAVGCGDAGSANCFEQGVTALTSDYQLGSDQGQLETMLMFSWMTVGFPASKSTYYDTNIGSSSTLAKKIVPKEGMVSRIEGTRKEIVEAAKSQVSSCSSAPTSGSFTTSSGMVLTWATPVMPIPADHPKAANKLYDKAITAAWTDSDDKTITYTGRFEFICSYNAMAMIVSTSISGTEKNRIVFFYDRDTTTKLYTDLYFYDNSGKFGSGGDALWLNFQMRGTDTSKFKAWVNRVGPNGTGKALGYRYAINANYSTPSISFYAVEVGTGNNSTTTEAEFLASSNATSSAVTGGVASATSNGTTATQGCSDSWMKKGSALTTSTTCSGLDLSEGPAFFWDSTSKNTLATLYSTGKDKILNLGK